MLFPNASANAQKSSKFEREHRQMQGKDSKPRCSSTFFSPNCFSKSEKFPSSKNSCYLCARLLTDRA